jgi:hypothetical protein
VCNESSLKGVLVGAHGDAAVAAAIASRIIWFMMIPLGLLISTAFRV